MNKFKFDTSKMSWNKAGLGPGGFVLTGMHIKFTDEAYFKQCMQIFKNLTNTIFVLVLTKKNNPQDSYILHNIKFTGYDFLTQTFKANIDKNSFAISGMTQEDFNNTGNINEWDLFILYK